MNIIRSHLGSKGVVHIPAEQLPYPPSHPQAQTKIDIQAKTHHATSQTISTQRWNCEEHKPDRSNDNLSKIIGFIRFLPSDFKYCLTLFSKSFSPFPHGTCSLSVSSLYLALGENYHPLYDPIRRIATLRTQAVHSGVQVMQRILTNTDVLSQGSYTCTTAGFVSASYNPKSETPVSMLSYSSFIRHY